MLSFTQIKSESDFWERLDTLFGPIRPFSGLSWNGRKLLFQTSLTVKNSTQTQLKHCRAKILMIELPVSRIFVKLLTL